MKRKINLLKLSAEEEADQAGLNYLPLGSPGYTRKCFGKNFRYFDAKGQAVTDKEMTKRFRGLVIPPAWQDVWISPDPKSHIQATGRDARGRKQYRYHTLWRACRDESKFCKMIEFAKALPGIRLHIRKGLNAEELSRQQILCAVLHLLETTLIRIGNEAYAKHNKSYGLTTIRDHHVEIKASSVIFEFKGKSGVMHKVKLDDRRMARIISRCHSLPGQLLFQYLDGDGQPRPIDSSDVNAFLREISGLPFSAKDFRTWCASVMALRVLRDFEAPQSKTHGQKTVKAAIVEVAKALRNTVAVCKKCYVHPFIIEKYLAGELHRKPRASERRRIESYQSLGLDADEATVLALLESNLQGKSKKAA